MISSLVSVIITTKNSERFIEACIKSIQASTYQDIEIIVVDNFSTDNTLEIAGELGAICFKQGPERSAQRNYGFQRSNGKFILILDVDMTVDKQLIEECVYCLEEGSFIDEALFIPEIVVAPGFWGKVRNFERSFYNSTRVDAVRFVRRSAWINFDTTISGAEDWDWDRRICPALFKSITRRCLYHNETDFNLIKYLKKKSYYAQYLDIYKKRYPNCPELNFEYRYFGVFVEYGKWKKILQHPILFAGVIILKILLGGVYLCTSKKY